MTSETQKALLQVWAKDVGHVVDNNNSPKAEFARLAKAEGWAGGDAEWCRHWTACFNETYKWGVGNRSITNSTTVDAGLAAQDGAIDLADRMRSLSVGSDASSFYVISRTSRAESFDSVRSLNSDQSHGDAGELVIPRSRSSTVSWNNADPQNSILSIDTVKSLEELSGGIKILTLGESIATDVVTQDSDTESEDSSQESDENPAWDDYTNFVHRPNAPFKSEFERLARIKSWAGRTKRQYLIKLLSTEVEFYWGAADVDRLEDYHFLCQEMGIEQIPSTVTQAKKALRPLKVNLYSVIDHMRNPEISIITYKTHRELRQNVQKNGTFPRECAKAGGGYMAVLLSKL